MKLRAIVFLGALFALTGPAWAQLEDPADIHIFSSTSFSQSGGGTDWITLSQFGNKFTIEDISNKDVNILPWHIVFAIPNQTGTLADLITKIGTTSVSISPGPEAILTSGSAYDALGVSGADNSVRFNNFVAADTTLGLVAPTSYGLNDFSVGSLALLNKAPLDIEISGSLPKGTIIFGYGFGDDSKLYATAMTNSGVVSPLAAVPEPSTIALAVAGGLSLLLYGYVAHQRKLKALNGSGLAVNV